jgi:hypothetical protein
MKRSHVSGVLILVVVLLMSAIPEGGGNREGFTRTFSDGLQMFGKFNSTRRKIRNYVDSTKDKAKLFIYKVVESIRRAFHKLLHLV